ncbi:hypothetical protein BDK51DRAFT_18323, partial [Blyttiomyces helicus]
VNEIRDSMEVVQSAEYPRFLALLIPPFSSLLVNEPAAFVSNSPEQKLRLAILEIIHRFPHNDALKNYAVDLVKTLIHILKEDNEDNACLALKIVVDLFKTYRTPLEDLVQSFFDLVQDMYRNMKQAVKDTFDTVPGTVRHQRGGENGTEAGSWDCTPGHAQPASPAGADGGEASSTKVLGKSMYSFKVLSECPIIIALLFQIHRKAVPQNVQAFVPLVMEVRVDSKIMGPNGNGGSELRYLTWERAFFFTGS